MTYSKNYLPLSRLDFLLRRGRDPLIRQPVQEAQLVLLAVQAPGGAARVSLAEGEGVEVRYAVRVKLESRNGRRHHR